MGDKVNQADLANALQSIVQRMDNMNTRLDAMIDNVQRVKKSYTSSSGSWKTPYKEGDFTLDSSGDSDDERDDDGAAIDDGDELASLSLVASRTLGAYVKTNVQRENLFHTRMYANGKPSSVIIDGESCTNIVSDYLVKELQLPTSKHPKPYSLGWFNDGEEIRVNKQVLVSLSLGRYKEDILCDVLPMRACHVLLGKPWQYENKVKHDKETNKYSFCRNVRVRGVRTLPFNDLKGGKTIEILWESPLIFFNLGVISHLLDY
ncbi:hypothetical protein CCACVL1_02831 [Corchorus capsularis]|uniref:Uncharacterized protein n=1 Tax=Corchorus capsularis TaxID=210143 RepID=A0A1R3K5F4_COCAP|nr:hypothetical protein CCACVL1_02831 [Corchorus capsularis]